MLDGVDGIEEWVQELGEWEWDGEPHQVEKLLLKLLEEAENYKPLSVLLDQLDVQVLGEPDGEDTVLEPVGEDMEPDGQEEDGDNNLGGEDNNQHNNKLKVKLNKKKKENKNKKQLKFNHL